MTEPSNDQESATWHRRFAAESNNRAWRLSEATSRTAAEDREMLEAAHAAAYHWRKAGTEVHAARADMLVAHVNALLGHGSIAMRYARASLDSVTSRASPDWEVAFAHAVLANAASAAGDPDLHAHHHALAKKIGLALANAEERQIFEATFSRIPVPVVTTGPTQASRREVSGR
jgi:hypothetical protein